MQEESNRPSRWFGLGRIEAKLDQIVNRVAAVALLGVLSTAFLLSQTPEKTPPPAATVNQLMQSVFFPQSNVVFSTQRYNPEEIKRAAEPSGSSDPLTGVFGGWNAVENGALTLIDLSDLLLTPGRTCSNGKAAPIAAPDWVKFVNDLRVAGKVAYDASKTKDMDKMLDASEVLATSCANCHNRYRRANRCQ